MLKSMQLSYYRKSPEMYREEFSTVQRRKNNKLENSTTGTAALPICMALLQCESELNQNSFQPRPGVVLKVLGERYQGGVRGTGNGEDEMMMTMEGVVVHHLLLWMPLK
jgi:hypothetical protein